MNSVQLMKNIKKDKFREFVEGSNIAVVSDNIQTDGSMDNTVNMVHLMPQQGLINILQAGDVIKFNDMYGKYLQSPAISVIIMGLLKKCMDEDKDLILLCAEDEDKAYGYLETLGFFLAAAFSLEPVPLKKVVKGKTEEYDLDNEELGEIIGEAYARAQGSVPNVMEVVSEIMMTKEERKKLAKKREKEAKKNKKKK